MDVNRKELSDIKDVLKESPRGMTVTEISKAVSMNRHSVAKYLEVLVTAGHVDMKSFGPSKVYYLSQRVPISAMLSFSSDLIVIIDEDLLIRNANDKFFETMGLAREKAMNRNIENLLHPMQLASTIMSHIKESLGGKELTLDTSYNDGPNEVYYTVKFIPTVFDDGNNGVTIIMSDVTEHRRIENAIRASERKFRDMIRQSTDGITLCDEKGVMIEYNESMAALTGLPRENVIGKYVWEIPFFMSGYEQIPARPPAQLKDYTQIFLKTGKSPLTDRYNIFDIRRPDGTIRTAHANIFTIRTEKGYMLAAIVRDITEMKKAEMSIHESEARFRSVIEQSLDGILIIDGEGRVIEFNRGLERITGFKKDLVMGMPSWSLYNKIMGMSGKEAPQTFEALKNFVVSNLNTHMSSDRKFFEIEIGTADGTRRVLQALAFRIDRPDDERICAIVRDITVQKQAETLLKESEEKFRNLAETTTSGILILQDDRIVYANHGAENITGYTVNELLNKSMPDFIHPDYTNIIDVYRQEYKNPARTSKMLARSWEIKIIKKNKAERWIDGSIGMMTLNGKPALIKTFFDITGRKQMEEALKKERSELETRVKERTIELESVNEALKAEVEQRRRSEEAARKSREKYQNLVERINDVAWQEDDHGRYTYMSPRILDILGYEPAEVLGRIVLDFMDEEESKRIEGPFWQLFREPKNYSFYELNLRHKDGHSVVLQTNGTPCYDENRTLLGYQGVARDITEKKRTEEALRQSEERFRSLVENINDIVWEMDKQARFTYVCPKVHDILGYGPEHYIGKVIVEFMPQEDVQKFSDGFGRIFARPRPYSLENLRMFHKDGSIHSMEVNGMPFYDNSGEFCGFHGVTRDITKRKGMEEIVELMTYSMTHVDVANFWISLDTGISHANDAAGRLLGYTIQELNAIRLSDIDAEYGEAKWREHWELLKKQKYKKSTTSYRTKDGKAIPVEVTGNYVEFNGRGYDYAFIRLLS